MNCDKCGKDLAHNNRTGWCFSCWEKRRAQIAQELEGHYYRVPHIAEFLGYTSDESVRRLVREGSLPEQFPYPTEIGRELRWLRQQVDLWMELATRGSAVNVVSGQAITVDAGALVTLKSGVDIGVTNSGDVIRPKPGVVVARQDVPPADGVKGEEA
jgi:predicted DNA-binding transcriptional regulator AlpA